MIMNSGLFCGGRSYNNFGYFYGDRSLNSDVTYGRVWLWLCTLHTSRNGLCELYFKTIRCTWWFPTGEKTKDPFLWVVLQNY